MPKKRTCTSCRGKDFSREFIDPCDRCEEWVCTNCSKRIWRGMYNDELDVCKSCARTFDSGQILNGSGVSSESSENPEESSSSSKSSEDSESSSSSSKRDKSPKRPKKRKDLQVTIDFLVELGMEAWRDIECAWVKETKSKWALVTKEIIKEKLVKGETFTYFWFVHDGYAGEGYSLELAVPPKDTGMTLSCQRKSQMGDSPKKSRRWEYDTDTLNLLYDGFVAFVAKIMHPSRKVRKPMNSNNTIPEQPKKRKPPQDAIDLLARSGIDAWQDIELAWLKTMKANGDPITKKVIKEKLLKGETFTFFWFIHEGAAGEGLSIELEVPPKNTGMTLSCQWKSQTGDGPKRGREWASITDSGDLKFGGLMGFIDKIMNAPRKVQKPVDSGSKTTPERDRDASPERRKSPPTAKPVAEPPSPTVTDNTY